MPSEAFKTFEIISWILICVLGTIGNVLVVLVVYRKRKMKTVTNYFIVNLAMADLAVLLVNVPLDVAVYFANGNWLYGGFLCNIIRPLQTLATTASVWSLVAISISRYIAIVHPLKPQLRRTHARWIIPPVWAISLVMVSPYMASLNMKDGTCIEDFEAVGMVAKYYTLGLSLGQYVVPLVIIAFAYLRVAQELTKNPNHDERTEIHYSETKKVLKMLVIVVLVFAVLVLPHHIVYLWKDFFHGNSNKHFKEIRSVALIMLYGNSFTNPIIYNACNEEFRKCFRGYFSLWIKPCARLVLGDRLRTRWPAIFDDIESTIPRSQKHGSFRRSSRRDTFTRKTSSFTRGTNNNCDTKNHDCIMNNSKKNGHDTAQVDAGNYHIILLHKDNIEQYHTIVCGINDGIQYVSGL